MNNILVEIYSENNRYIKFTSQRKLSDIVLHEFTTDNNSTSSIDEKGSYIYRLPLLSYNAFIIRCIEKKFKNISYQNEDVKNVIIEQSNNTQSPEAFMMNENWIGFKVPSIPSYTRLLTLLNANNRMLTLWSVPLNRLYDIYRYLKIWKHPFLPPISVSNELHTKITEPLEDKYPNIEDLFNVQLSELSTIKGALVASGRARAKLEGFQKLKYETAVDLLLAKPKSYTDRTNITFFHNAPFGERAFVKCKIIKFNSLPNRAGQLTVTDGYSEQEILIWGAGWQSKYYSAGDIILLEVTRIGKDKYNGISIVSEEEAKALPIIPNYRQSPSNNISNKLLTNATQELLLRYNGEKLFDYVTGAKTPFWTSLENLHFPSDAQNFEDTLEALAYYELLCLQLIFLANKKEDTKSLGIPKISNYPKLLKESLDKFKYEPTKGQQEATEKIIELLKSPYSEEILLSGDVGSGKSLVANSACFYTVDCGYQAVLAGPTEILAQQLYDGLMEQVKDMKIKPNIAYLSGKTKAKDKKEIIDSARKGIIDILVGTHSVFDVTFKNLGLVVIDEQQKFGKAQREKLNKSRADGRVVDILEQTATPIPQTTALAFYGDKTLISLTEKPGGRKENITKWIKKDSKDFLNELFNPVWEHIFKEIKAGHQIFIVTPAVEEESKSASVKKTAKILQQKFPDIKIDYIHGGLKKEKQNQVIEKFRANKTSVLIASSIVEVGIDIPNSTIMLVLDANKFGAGSLHQIRGRVGRSDLQGYCYLVASPNNANATKRLQSLVDTNNGFEIALVDLETRNTGDLFSSQQSGKSNLKFCNLVNHGELIEKARFEAENIFENEELRDIALKDARAFLKQTDGDEE